MYKKSQFNVEIPTIGGLLIFNSYSGKVIKFTDIESILWLSDDYVNLSDVLSYLLENHFLIDSTVNEIDKLLEESRYISAESNTSHFRILTTTCCNANCEYCYEKGVTPQTLSIHTADEIVSYITERSKDKKRITLTWFGGEPLLNVEIITYIMLKLKEHNSNKHIITSMTTNGSLVDDKIVELAKSTWNLERIQITFDGMEKRHDEIKNYNNKKYGFKQTISNVHNLVNAGIHISLRINYSTTNLQDVLPLIDYLYSEFKNSVSVYCAPIFSSELYNSTYDPSNLKIADTLIFEKLQKYNYISPKKVLKRRFKTCAFATYRDHLVIDPDGNLFKCCEAMLHPDVSHVGNIWSKNLDEELISSWCSLSLRDECMLCPYVPLCLGGCKCASFNINTSKCFRYKNIIPEIIHMEYVKNHL